MGDCPGEMPRDGWLRGRSASEWAKCLAPGLSPGQSALRQGIALTHGARPGETPRNGILPRPNVSKWVIARAKCQEMLDCARGAPRNGQRALRQGARQGKVPGARASPLRMALAPAKRPEMGFRPGEMPPPAGTPSAKCLPPCDSRKKPHSGRSEVKFSKGGSPSNHLTPQTGWAFQVPAVL